MRHFTVTAVLVSLLAACDGAGGEATIRPEDLTLRIIRGQALTGQVVGAADYAAEVVPQPIVVRISSVGGPALSITGPSSPSFAAIPAGTVVNWRVIDGGCDATAFAAVTAVAGSDTVINYWRAGKKSGTCRMVAEGISGGVMFGSDTATAVFEPGPYVGGYEFSGGSTDPSQPVVLSPLLLRDGHGNHIPFRAEVDSAAAPWVAVQGGTWGSDASRSLLWSYDGLTGPFTTALRLLAENGALIATASVQVHPGGGRLTYWID